MTVRRWGSGAALLVAALVVACGSFSTSEPTPDTSGDAGQDAIANDAPGSTTDGGMPGDGAGDGALPPVPVVLGAGYNGLSGIAATETDVYFIEQSSGNIDTVPLAGGQVRTLVATGASPHTLTIAKGQLYWADTGKGTLSRLPIATAISVPPTNVRIGFSPATIVASDMGVVALLTGADPVDGQVAQYDFTLTETGFSVGGQQNPFGAALFGNEIFWTESAGHHVRHGTFGTVTNDVWSDNQFDSETIAADKDGVYWSAGTNIRMSSTTTGTALDVSTTEDTPSSLTTDAASAYWLTKDSLRRWDKVSGSKPTTLAKGVFGFLTAQFRGIAVTNSYVVWITADGNVMRLAKSW